MKLCRSERGLRGVCSCRALLFFLLLIFMAGCGQQREAPTAVVVQPTATSVLDVATATPLVQSENFVTIATDAPYPPFAHFDEFGNVVGFDAELAGNLMERAGYDYEFVVTNYDGMLQSVADGEFDMAVSALSRSEPEPGVRFSEPYLEVGQVLVVLANEQELVSPRNVPPDALIGVLADAQAGERVALAGERAALDVLDLAETSLNYYETVGQAMQALRDGDVRGVIVDHDDAEHYTRTYYEQFKIAGGSGREAWITQRDYVIAVDADNRELLRAVNEAIAQARADGTVERIVRNHLVSRETIDAGESLIGTPDDMIVIGVLGQIEHVDPAAPPSLIGWEVDYNTMSGLYMFDGEGNLLPLLAEGQPEVSEDGMEYTFTLRSGLAFPDGSPFTADDVKASVNRAAVQGNWHVNTFLKDSDGDSIADTDAVQVLSPTSVHFVLRQPVPYFLNLLATPPFFVISEECYATDPNAARTCNGIGPYQIIEWKANEPLQLQANPQWPGENKPAFENIQLRFYEDAEGLRNAMTLGAVDMAWGDLPGEAATALLSIPEVRIWESRPTFKSYLVFQQDGTPWENVSLRQAAAYAVDREVLARSVFKDERAPLYSPLPSSEPFHVATEPQRDLERARELLQLVGYSEQNPLVIPLWYLNDGRYTPLEQVYAEAIKEQLEETGMIEVELNGAPWDVYSVQMTACNYTTFLLGWPPVDWPTRYPAAMGWIEYFVTNTDSLCSNYSSAAMDALLAEVQGLDAEDVEGQRELYAQIQALWAQEYPTLDLTEAGRRALAWDSIDNVQFDRMGLLRYDTLTKQPAAAGG